jgi:hypothetical protein
LGYEVGQQAGAGSGVAYLAAGLNLAAGVATLVLLRPGLPGPGTTPAGRLAYLETQTGAWWAGWLCWQGAALSLLGLFVVLAARWRGRAPVRCGLALLCGAAGLAADVSAQAVYMGVAPRIGPAAFPAVEAAAGLLTGYVGNGLYTVAGILLTWAGRAELPRLLLALAVPVWGAGLWLSAASLAQSATGQLLSTAVLIPSFVLWSTSIGRWLSVRAGPGS